MAAATHALTEGARPAATSASASSTRALSRLTVIRRIPGAYSGKRGAQEPEVGVIPASAAPGLRFRVNKSKELRLSQRSLILPPRRRFAAPVPSLAGEREQGRLAKTPGGVALLALTRLGTREPELAAPSLR